MYAYRYIIQEMHTFPVSTNKHIADRYIHVCMSVDMVHVQTCIHTYIFICILVGMVGSGVAIGGVLVYSLVKAQQSAPKPKAKSS